MPALVKHFGRHGLINIETPAQASDGVRNFDTGLALNIHLICHSCLSYFFVNLTQHCRYVF